MAYSSHSHSHGERQSQRRRVRIRRSRSRGGDSRRVLWHSLSLRQVDLVAVPDFGAGAMENAGLITYRDRMLLFDKKTGTEDELRGYWHPSTR